MFAKLKIADLVAAGGGILLFVSSLLDQFGIADSYNAWHGLVLNELIVTYLLGLVAAAVSVAASLGLLPTRWPWAAWSTATAFAVLLNAIFAAIALSRLLTAATSGEKIGLGPGVYLGIAAAAVLFVGVGLRDVVPGLASAVTRPTGGDRGPAAIPPVAGGPYPDVTFGAPVRPFDAPAAPAPAPFTPVEPRPAPAIPEPAPWTLSDVTLGRPTQVQPTQVQPTQVQPTQVQPTQVQPTQVQPTQVQTTQTPPFQPQAPAPFTPFWAAVPTSRPLYRTDDPSAVLASLRPGTWYAAVAPHSHGLIVQLASGETGVLVEVADLFRG